MTTCDRPCKRFQILLYLADGSPPGGVKRTAGDGLMTRWDGKRDAIRVGTASGRGRNPVRSTASLRPDRVGQSQALVDEKLQSVDEVVRDDDDQQTVGQDESRRECEP